MRSRGVTAALAVIAAGGAVAAGAWFLHEASVWSGLATATTVSGGLHPAALRLASLLIAAVAVVGALLLLVRRNRPSVVAAVLLLGAAVLVVIGLQVSPVHIWSGAFHPESGFRFPHRFREGAVTDFAAAAACLAAVATLVVTRGHNP